MQLSHVAQLLAQFEMRWKKVWALLRNDPDTERNKAQNTLLLKALTINKLGKKTEPCSPCIEPHKVNFFLNEKKLYNASSLLRQCFQTKDRR